MNKIVIFIDSFKGFEKKPLTTYDDYFNLKLECE